MAHDRRNLNHTGYKRLFIIFFLSFKVTDVVSYPLHTRHLLDRNRIKIASNIIFTPSSTQVHYTKGFLCAASSSLFLFDIHFFSPCCCSCWVAPWWWENIYHVIAMCRTPAVQIIWSIKLLLDGCLQLCIHIWDHAAFRFYLYSLCEGVEHELCHQISQREKKLKFLLVY